MGKEMLAKVKKTLRALYGDRFRSVVLYGSEARGQAQADSDIDFLVLLEGPVDSWSERKRILRALYDLQLAIPERHLSFMPVDIQDYESQSYALYRHARQEGVPL